MTTLAEVRAEGLCVLLGVGFYPRAFEKSLKELKCLGLEESIRDSRVECGWEGTRLEAKILERCAAPAGTVSGAGRCGMWPRSVDEQSIAQD